MTGHQPSLRRDQLLRECFRIRLVEEAIIDLYPSDKIQSPVHMSIGQEAVAVGVCAALRSDDLLFPTYRSHAFVLAKGGSLRTFFAELYGKATGEARGKAGSMHLLATDVGVMPASAIVASTIPVAVGAALAEKRRGADRIVVAVFGDGATEEGVHHESLNLAALLSVPVLLLCEDNGFAVHARLHERQTYAIADLAARYGIEVTVIEEGYDPEIVAHRLLPVVEAMRRDGKPRYVVIKTYRYKQHVGPEDDFDAGYRGKAELEQWQTHDPLLREGALMDGFRPALEAEIAEAIAFAEDSPWPGPETLLDNVG